MYVNIIKSYREVVAICDSELLGKEFEEGEFKLELKESFYSGEEKTPEETETIIKNMSHEDATFNIVGKNSVELAIKTGVVKKNGVKEIQGIPFAMVLM